MALPCSGQQEAGLGIVSTEVGTAKCQPEFWGMSFKIIPCTFSLFIVGTFFVRLGTVNK